MRPVIDALVKASIAWAAGIEQDERTGQEGGIGPELRGMYDALATAIDMFERTLRVK